jgi:hypothetical protein
MVALERTKGLQRHHDSQPTEMEPVRRSTDARRHGLHDHRSPRDEFLSSPLRSLDDRHGDQHDWQRVLLVPQQVTKRPIMVGQSSRQLPYPALKCAHGH